MFVSFAKEFIVSRCNSLKIASLLPKNEVNNLLNEKADADDVEAIEGLVPSQATAQNQLADKSFVNSSISTNTAYFRGTFDVVEDLELTVDATAEEIAAALAEAVEEVTNNDYVFVYFEDSSTAEPIKYERFKYTEADAEWAYEYTLNNSSFTAEQWNAMNSGITSGLVALIDTALQPSALNNYYNKTEMDSSLGDKVDKVDGKGLSANDFTNLYKAKVDNTYTKTEVDDAIADAIADVDELLGSGVIS